MEKKDIIILGGGPGGYVAAIKAARLGKSVLLVERERLGGTCLNFGCIPTKTYYHDAQTIRDLKNLCDVEVFEGSAPKYNMQKAYDRKQDIVNKLVSGVEQLIKGNGIELINGVAELDRPNYVKVDGREYYSDNIVIATGSEDTIPSIQGIDNDNVLTVKEFLQLTEIPEKLTIIGGGVIGIEFACIFSQLGSEVSVIEYAPNILGNIDSDISKRMKVFLKKQGIDLYLNSLVKSLDNQDNGKLIVKFQDKKGEHEILSDKALIATGRKACLDGINIDALGLDLQKGFINVDNDYKTNIDGLYAIGDVIGGQMLAHVASHEGEIVVDKIFGKDTHIKMSAVPACVFSFPEIASVGLTEDQAKEKGIEIKTGRANYASNGKAMTICETDGFIKVVADESGKIIGVHIMGAHADDIILEATVLVDMGVNVDRAQAFIHPHPTLGEVLSEAIADVNKGATHILYKK